MFSLTSAAAQQIQQSAADSQASEMALRIAAKLDPEGSLQYGMGFDEAHPEDLQLDLEGIQIVIGSESQALLANTVLDFVELNPGEFNFIFSEVNEASCTREEATSGGCSNTGCGAGGCAGKGRAH
jgi:iron-sulfur cluster assembly protein